jgi:type IV pilus assembly protein PilV
MTAQASSKLEASRRWRRGYTIVELMMAIAVFAIGVSGIIAMQKVAAAANQHSRALSLATNIAQAWQDQLNADASLYTRTNGFTFTKWLAPLQTSTQTTWFRPPYSTTLQMGAAFDGLGKPLSDDADQVAQAQFCVHLRLVRLYPSPADVGIDVVRTEVRVIWPRTEGAASATFCDTITNPVTLGTDMVNYHYLYQVSAVRQQ